MSVHDRLIGDVVKCDSVYYVVINAMEDDPLIVLINPLTNTVIKKYYNEMVFTGVSYDIQLRGLRGFITTGKGIKIDLLDKCVVNG